MLKNYLKVALRSLKKQKLYGFVNVFGLAVGIACCLLVGLYVRSELSFDRFHTNADQLYRAWVVEDYGPDQVFTNTVTPYILAPTLEASYPEVEAAVRIQSTSGTVRRESEALNEQIVFVDTLFLSVFDFPLAVGNASTALARRDGVVLTESVAARHFGDANPLGEALTLLVADTEIPVVVAAVAEDPPEASSIQFGVLVPFGQMEAMNRPNQLTSWTIVSPETYVLVQDGTSGEALEAKLPAMMQTALGPDFEGTYTVHLQPMPDMHLDPSLPVGIAPVSDPRYVTILSVIALLVLLIACINFTTLAMGRSVERMREVGVRKALGAARSQLMGQFWGEALVMTLFALVVGLVLAAAALPLFNDLAGRHLSLRPDVPLMFFTLGLVVVVGLVAGGYPAVVLSRFRPTEVLRGRIRFTGRTGIQQGLVALQFACSVALIGGTLVMTRQLAYLQTANLGYKADRVVVVPDALPLGTDPETVASLAAMLERESIVENVTASAFSFGDPSWGGVGYDDEQGRYRTFSINAVAPGFLRAFNVTLAQGEPFAELPSRAAQQAVVNEAFAEAFDLGDRIGQPLPAPFDAYELAGVISGLHYESLHAPIEPLMLVTAPQALFDAVNDVGYRTSPNLDVQIRLAAGPLPAAMEVLERAWTDAVPEQPFDFIFLDDALDAQYRAEERLRQIASVAAVLAMLIACLGLFGLAALLTARRTKEIGIRKVLGASVGSIVGLLSKDFVRLVLLGFGVATPLVYLLMRSWLEGFAYRIDLGLGVFLFTGALVLLVALLTVSTQAFRAAAADPIDALRYE